MLEVTEWAQEILAKADAAARRLNPDVVIRLATRDGVVQAVLAQAPEAGDEQMRLPGATVYAEQGLTGVVDVEEPHDRLVLRPPGSASNARGH